MKTVFTLAVLLIMITGCKAGNTPGVKEDPIPLEAYPHIEAIGDAKKYVMAAQPIVTGGGPTPLSVNVPIRSNQSYSDVHVQYKFTFFDIDGNELQPEMSWMPKTLYPRSQTQVSATAIDTTAVDWRLTIRIGR